MATKAKKGAGATAAAALESSIPMVDVRDRAKLTPSLTFLRGQLEYFAATQRDVSDRFSKGGRSGIVVEGQIGIRCIHCKHRPSKERANGHTAFPASTSQVYQAVRNWQRYHFNQCREISDEMKVEFKEMKKGKSSRDIGNYWIDSCRRKGLKDCKTENASIIIYEESAKNEERATSSSIEPKHAPDILAENDHGLSDHEQMFGDSTEIDDVLVTADVIDGGDDNVESRAISTNNETSQYGASAVGDGVGLDAGNVGLDHTYNFSFDEENLDVMVADKESPSLEETEGNSQEDTLPSHGDGVKSSKEDEDFEPIVINNTAGQNMTDFSNLDAFNLFSSPTIDSTTVLQKVQGACGIVEAFSREESGPDSLRILGERLYEHFAGFQPLHCTTDSKKDDIDDADGTFESRQKKGKTTVHIIGECVPLSECGFPLVISNLIQHLLRVSPGGNCVMQGQHYSTAEDVLEELLLICRDPDRYLFAEDPTRVEKLDLIDGKLYGREGQLAQVHMAFQSLVGSSCSRSILCITGASGTGKSALAIQMKAPVENVDGFFLDAKFDELQQVKQMPVIFLMLDVLCSKILHQGGSLLKKTKNRLKASLGSEINVLLSTIPKLQAIVGESISNHTPDLTGQASFNRLLYSVRQLIKSISSKAHPVVVMLDDVQWADEFSLSLIQAICLDKDVDAFLLLACYRDIEFETDHPLQKTLSTIRRCGAVTFNEIRVDNIDRASVASLISDALHMTPMQARPLSDLIYTKTSGQPLFVIQFLKSLKEEGLLRWSLSHRQWEWDVDEISSMNVDDNVADIMTNKMLRYPEEVLWSLKTAACLGHQFDSTTISLLDSGFDGANCPTLADHLDTAVVDGLLIRTTAQSLTTYRFSHDQIQLAAYSLLNSDEQSVFHLEIARTMLKRVAPEKLDSVLFIITDQFGRGLPLMTNRTEKTKVSRLFLRAAQKASSIVVYSAASVFTLQGLSLLDDDHWRTDYELILCLYSLCAETHSIGGAFDQVEISSSIVFNKARCFEDTLPVCLCLVQATASQGMLPKAIATALDVLRKLDVVLPANPDPNMAMMLIEETRAKLESMPTTHVFSRPMKDKKALCTMKMLALLSHYAFMTDKNLMGMAMCQMVRLSVEHGVCTWSIVAIGCYAYLLGNTGQLALGHKYKNISLKLIDQFNAREATAATYINVYTQIIPIDPVQAIFPQLEVAYRTAAEYGDFHMRNAAMNCDIALRVYFGDSLPSIDAAARSHLQEMDQMNDSVASVSTRICLQVVVNLMDPSCVDPTLLTGRVTDQSAILAKAKESHYVSLVMQIYRHRIHLAYLFQRYDLASELVESMMEKFGSSGLLFQNCGIIPTTFMVGLVSLHLARHKDKANKKWSQIAADCMGKMKGWSEASLWNYGHMMRLMEAEHAYSKGQHETAMAAYEDAIRLAGQHKFVHDHALCYERAALFYFETASDSASDRKALDLSKVYIAEARELYRKWGALRKVADMELYFN